MRGCFLLGLSLALACQEPSTAGDEGGDDGSTGLPSPYADSGDESGQDQPALVMEQVVASGVGGLQTFIALQPDALVAAYTGIAVLEEGCPEEWESFDEGETTTTVWYSEAGCTTSEGVEFRGGGRLVVESRLEGETMIDATTLSSEGGTLRVSNGDTFFQMTGYVAISRAAGPEVTEAGFELGGEFSADPGTADGSPLMDGSLTAQGFIYSFSDGTNNAIGGSGSLSGEGLADARAFSFSDVLVILGQCATEPIGTLSVRDDVGFWHDIVFDAGSFDPQSDDEPIYDAESCDGCGAYLAGGERLGDACVSVADVESLLDWENAPW
ncbi:MAG: hypothetical protein AAF721_40695 [Myxococcota bacterium]